VNDLQFADDVLARIRARGGAYHERAYLFILATVEYIQTRLPVRRHVSGQELAWACRDLARDQFGLLAPHVLAHWGVTRTEDFGRLVYTLVDVGLLVTQPGDCEHDFAEVYAFAEAFVDDYAWTGVGNSRDKRQETRDKP
jgi:uncharacterized repeat protein (TIGR04138 family)